MKTEFEATFTGIDKITFRKTLKRLGAILILSETLMRRVVFHPPTQIDGGWMRVRDEGNKITMSIKQVRGNTIKDQKESCLVIDDFEEGVRFLTTIGAKKKSYQETKREHWRIKNCDVTIDTWPGLKPYVEIEGPAEKSVRRVAQLLELDYETAMFGSVDSVYQQELGIPPDVINNQTPEITFKHPPKRFRK